MNNEPLMWSQGHKHVIGHVQIGQKRFKIKNKLIILT